VGVSAVVVGSAKKVSNCQSACKYGQECKRMVARVSGGVHAVVVSSVAKKVSNCLQMASCSYVVWPECKRVVPVSQWRCSAVLNSRITCTNPVGAGCTHRNTPHVGQRRQMEGRVVRPFGLTASGLLLNITSWSGTAHAA
jgi:hypothetical protein